MRDFNTTDRQELQDRCYDIPYHWVYQNSNKKLYELRTRLVLHSMGDLNRKNILDFGCGDGRFTSELIGSGASLIVGADTSEKALRFARCLVSEAEFHTLKGKHIPYPTNFFDAVVALDVIEHIVDTSVAHWASEIQRVLKVGGRIVVTVPSKRIPKGITHYRHYKPDELTQFLEMYFSVISIEGYFFKPLWLPYILFKLHNLDIIWKLYRNLIRECDPQKGAYLLALAEKK